jgi:hypothetical protein
MIFLGIIVIALRFNIRQRLFLGLWLFIPPTVTFLISFRLAMYMDRYLILSLPAFILLASIGLSRINSDILSRLAYFIVTVATLIGLVRVFYDDSVYERADWRALS